MYSSGITSSSAFLPYNQPNDTSGVVDTERSGITAAVSGISGAVLLKEPDTQQTILPLPGLYVRPLGLEYLNNVDQVVIFRQPQEFDVQIAYKAQNKYIALTSQGHFLYYIIEEGNTCTRMCCEAKRCFNMYVYDYQKRLVMQFSRPLRCQSRFRGLFCCCCLQQMQVEAPSGTVIGYVCEDFAFCCPSFSVCAPSGNAVITVQGPCINNKCWGCCNNTFTLRTLGGHTIGIISKQWFGVVKDALAATDSFGVTFPRDLDLHAKACLIACTMLVDYMFFEQGRRCLCC
ncbi:phospholipid scramblase 2-like isoform X2 [Ornithodoros turicata]|uniref:phospholipid scramblase 2-like isoform X2 n=1 Tax=Ornithodoros turicata TaxID=34597 RepID=UPI00313A2EB2